MHFKSPQLQNSCSVCYLKRKCYISCNFFMDIHFLYKKKLNKMVRLNERQVLIAMWRDEFTATHCGYQKRFGWRHIHMGLCLTYGICFTLNYQLITFRYILNSLSAWSLHVTCSLKLKTNLIIFSIIYDFSEKVLSYAFHVFLMETV